MPVLSRAPKERSTIQTPTWDLWLTNLVTAVNEATAAIGGPAAAGTLTGTTLAANVVNSSLTGVGTLTSGATGAGFTLNFGTSTLSGVVPVANGGTGNSSLTVNRIPYGNGTSPFQSDADLTFDGSTFTLNGLANLSGAAGGQIQFPATQNPSANANTFDDYEEGGSGSTSAWTPADASGAGLALTISNAQYLKWGQGVMATASITYPVTANANAAQIGGLPFPSQATSVDVYPVLIGFSNNAGGLVFTGRVNANASTFVFTTFAGANITNAQLSNSILRVTPLYRAAA